jgi:uncharacterized membrane protein
MARAAIALKPGRDVTSDSPTREAYFAAARLRNVFFLQALVIPVLALAGTLLLPKAIIRGALLVDPKQVTLVALAAGAMAGLGLAVRAGTHNNTAFALILMADYARGDADFLKVLGDRARGGSGGSRRRRVGAETFYRRR